MASPYAVVAAEDVFMEKYAVQRQKSSMNLGVEELEDVRPTKPSGVAHTWKSLTDKFVSPKYRRYRGYTIDIAVTIVIGVIPLINSFAIDQAGSQSFEVISAVAFPLAFVAVADPLQKLLLFILFGRREVADGYGALPLSTLFDGSDVSVVRSQEHAQESQLQRIRKRLSPTEFLRAVPRLVQSAIEDTGKGLVLDVYQLVISILACISFIQLTYTIPLDKASTLLLDSEHFVFCTFLYDYLLRLYLLSGSREKLLYLIDVRALADLVSLAPFLIEFYSSTAPTDQVLLFSLSFRFLRLIRLVKLLAFIRSKTDWFDAQVEQMMVSVMNVLCILFFAAGAFVAIEGYSEGELGKHSQQFKAFFSALYFVVVTVTTVGFGDLYPETSYGRAFAALVIIAAMSVLPSALSQLYHMAVSRQTQYRQRFVASVKKPHHIVVGKFPDAVEIGFNSELLHEDHGSQEQTIVLLQPEPPREQLRQFLQLPFYSRRIFFQLFEKGDNLEEVFCRADAGSALAIFFVLDAQSESRDREINVQLMGVRRSYPDVDTYVLLYYARNVFHAKMYGATAVVSVEQLKHRVLALNCVCPGATPLLHNLTSSTCPKAEVSDPRWWQEYTNGASHEIYRVRVPRDQAGKTFATLARDVWEAHALIFFGLLDRHLGRVLLFPSERKLRESEICYIFAMNDDLAAICFAGLQPSSIPPTGPPVTNSPILKASPRLTAVHVDVGTPEKKGLSRNPRRTSADPSSPSHLLKHATSSNTFADVINVLPPPEAVIMTSDVRSIVSGHVLLCVLGETPDLEDFVESLRSPTRVVKRPIVVLSQTPWELSKNAAVNNVLCERYSEIYFTLGDPTQPESLLRAGAEHAKQAVIVHNCGAFDDDSAVHCFNTLEYLSRDRKGKNGLFITTEIASQEKIRLLGARAGDDAFFQTERFHLPAFTSGCVYSPMQPFQLLVQERYNNGITGIIEEMISTDTIPGSSYLTQVSVGYRGDQMHTFDQLFKDLLAREDKMLALALYRQVPGKPHQHYVYTNPSKDTKLKPTDRVFALSITMP